MNALTKDGFHEDCEVLLSASPWNCTVVPNDGATPAPFCVACDIFSEYINYFNVMSWWTGNNTISVYYPFGGDKIRAAYEWFLEALLDIARLRWRWQRFLVILLDASGFGIGLWLYYVALLSWLCLMTISPDCLSLEVPHDHTTWCSCLLRCVMIISLNAPAFRSASWSYHLTLLPLEVLHNHITWHFCRWKCLIVYHLMLLTYRSSW
jgi:hypothetical protein